MTGDPPAPGWSPEPPPPPPPPPQYAPSPAPPGYASPGYASPHPGTSTNGFAVAALVLGILGPVMCVGWVLALVFGYIAKSQIDASGGRQTGRGMAVAGIILGWVWGGLAVLYVVVLVVAAVAT